MLEYNSKSFATTATQVTDRTFLNRVFTWMALALSMTALTAYYFSSSPSLLQMLYTQQGMTTLGYIVMFAPIGFVLLLSAGIKRFNAQTMAILFAAYAVIMGMSLNFIFLMYTPASIYKTFGIAAGMFAIMAFTGYTTKTDLSRFGSLMMMGLIGIILASVINFFLRSAVMDYIVSIIGVLVFTGLTAYDVQKIKRIGQQINTDTSMGQKMALMGALTLYLDFINLFLYLLRFLGDRRG